MKFYKRYNFFRVNDPATHKILADHPFTPMLIISHFLKGEKSVKRNSVNRWQEAQERLTKKSVILPLQFINQLQLQQQAQQSLINGVLSEFWIEHLKFDQFLRTNLPKLFVEFILRKNAGNLLKSSVQVRQILDELVKTNQNNLGYQLFAMLFGVNGYQLLNTRYIVVLKQLTSVCLNYRVLQPATKEVLTEASNSDSETKPANPEISSLLVNISPECRLQLITSLQDQGIRDCL